MVDRLGKGTGIGLGFVKGFNLRKGAFASTANAVCENIVIVGTNPIDMAVAANHLAEIGGGKVAVVDGEVVASVGLPLLGLHAEEPLEQVTKSFDSLFKEIRQMGCDLPSPFSQLEFCFACGEIGDLKLVGGRSGSRQSTGESQRAGRIVVHDRPGSPSPHPSRGSPVDVADHLDLEHPIGMDQRADFDRGANRVRLDEELPADPLVVVVVVHVRDEDIGHDDVGHGAAGLLHHRLDVGENLAPLGLGVLLGRRHRGTLFDPDRLLLVVVDGRDSRQEDPWSDLQVRDSISVRPALRRDPGS